jgi:hypothetical protein
MDALYKRYLAARQSTSGRPALKLESFVQQLAKQAAGCGRAPGPVDRVPGREDRRQRFAQGPRGQEGRVALRWAHDQETAVLPARPRPRDGALRRAAEPPPARSQPSAAGPRPRARACARAGTAGAVAQSAPTRARARTAGAVAQSARARARSGTADAHSQPAGARSGTADAHAESSGARPGTADAHAQSPGARAGTADAHLRTAGGAPLRELSRRPRGHTRRRPRMARRPRRRRPQA